MRNPRENSVFQLTMFLVDLSKSYVRGIQGLLGIRSKYTSEQQHQAFGLLHLLTWIGPKNFQKFPSGIKIGRSLFLPLLFIFKKK